MTDIRPIIAMRPRASVRLAPPVALMLLLAAGPSAAHKLNVFAAAEGARIDGSAYFAGGGKAAGAHIRITDAGGNLLAELRPDADGSFTYLAQAPIEHRIVAESDDGHRAEWTIDASELVGAFPAAAAGVTADASGLASRPASAPASAAEVRNTPPAGDAGGLDPALEAAIERAVARQVRPLREALFKAREAAQFRDVLGGIGYIVGLAGLALWWRARHPRRER